MGATACCGLDIDEKFNSNTEQVGFKEGFIIREDNIENSMSDEKKNDGDIQQITCYVIQGRNLPKYDIGINAKSDPYVKVSIGKAHYRTDTVRRELNPVWNSSFIKRRKQLFKQISSIKFDVYDHDKLTSDDWMGSCSINTDQSPSAHYSTAVQWLTLLDKKGNEVIGKNKGISAIQIKIKYSPNAEDLNVRYYTHIMELNIKKAHDVHSDEFIGKSDPYVRAEWGAQSYQTKYVSDTNKPVWNETAYLFVHDKFNEKFQLKLTVMDKDIGPDDLLGTGYYSKSKLFDNCLKADGKEFSFDVQLRMVPVGLDRGLIDFEKNKKFKRWGDIQCSAKLISRDVIERDFYKALVHSFDSNNDGVIDKSEVENMFATLKIPENVDTFFNKFDENNDSKWDEEETIKMLQNSDFQGSSLATQLMALYLKDKNNDINNIHFDRHLMSGFVNKPSESSKAISIKDRETGLLVQEFVPGYVWYAMKLIYDVRINRAIIQSGAALRILSKMSKNKGSSMNKKKSHEEIAGFIKQHNLSTNILYKKPSEFKTFNDFFARGVNVDKYRALALPNDELVVVSPADCRTMCFESILDATKFWIKGSKFTLEHLIKSSQSKIEFARYSGGSFGIFRLAPQDYHRWHWPLSGKVMNIEKLDGALYTVNPIAINKSVNVYTENKRAVLEIDCENQQIGRYLMFVIAATMVGSYKLHKCEAKDPTKDDPIPLKLGDHIKRGDVAGEFRFGGSTILVLFERNKVKFDEDIKRNVKAKFETLVSVRSRIGRIQ